MKQKGTLELAAGSPGPACLLCAWWSSPMEWDDPTFPQLRARHRGGRYTDTGPIGPNLENSARELGLRISMSYVTKRLPSAPGPGR